MSSYLPAIVLILFVLGVAGFSTLVKARRSKRVSNLMQSMGASLGLTYASRGDMKTVDATLTKRGTMLDVLSGIYQGRPVRIFTYQVLISEGKSVDWDYMTAFEMVSNAALPDLVLHSNEVLNEAVSVRPLFGEGYELIQLEGDFNKYFQLYVKIGSQIDALQIFAPDTMALLIDQYSKFAIEFIGNHFYLYPGKLLENEAEFNQALQLVDHLYAHVLPTLEEMRSGTPVS